MRTFFGQMVLAILVLGLTTGIATADLNVGLVAFWPMNGNAADATGNGHDGTVNGAEFVEDAERGTVLSVDGASTFVEVAHAEEIAFMDANAAMSVVVWVHPSVVPNSGWHTILAKNRDMHYNNAYGLWQNGSNYHFRYCTKTFNADNAATDEWKLLVLTYDGSSKTMKGYVNGTLINTVNEDPGTLGDSTLVIGGARNNDGASTPFEFYAGLIDDVAIYNRALDQTDINALAAGEEIDVLAIEPVGALSTTWGTMKN